MWDVAPSDNDTAYHLPVFSKIDRHFSLIYVGLLQKKSYFKVRL